MISDITSNLKAALQTLDSYGGTPTVEEERLFLTINNRYPFVLLSGPYSESNTQTHNVAITKVRYNIQYFVQYNDENQDDDEITEVTKNVTGDIIKKVMEDVSRGSNAIKTTVTDYGNAFELIKGGNVFGFVSDRIEFFLYVVIDVLARLEATDPSLLG